MQRVATDDRKKLLVLALVGILFSVSFAVVLNGNASARYRSDIFLRWYATDKLFSERRSLYDPRNAQEVTTYVHGSARKTNFYYPAHLLIFTGPLALLPYPVAHLVWTTTIQLFFMAAVWLSTRLVSWPDSINGQTLFLVMATLFIPNLQHTIWGQFNTIGVLSLVLCYQALRSGRYALAGLWAIGLTVKPHTTVLILVFLLIWALFKRERWGFYLGFVLSGLAIWAITELVQPGWVLDFFATLGQYRPSRSIVDLLWNPGQVVAGGLSLAAVAVFLRNRQAPVESAAFAGCLALSLGLWLLLVPVVGMSHTVILPVAVVLILSHLEQRYPALYRWALYGFLITYVLGIVGLLWGLSSPELYGMHITWSELAYKAVAPILVSLFSVPLCLGTGWGVVTED